MVRAIASRDLRTWARSTERSKYEMSSWVGGKTSEVSRKQHRVAIKACQDVSGLAICVAQVIVSRRDKDFARSFLKG